MWTDEQWAVFVALIDEWWEGSFDGGKRAAWRIALDRIAPETAMEAAKRLLHSGLHFRPSVSEFLAEVRRDPSLPTFEEAWRIIRYGLKARAQGVIGQTTQSGVAARTAAILYRLEQGHPAVREFVERYGLDRLRMLPVDDPQWGDKHLKELRESWERHVLASETRQVAVLASGRPDDLRRLDPLSGLGRPALALASVNQPGKEDQQ